MPLPLLLILTQIAISTSCHTFNHTKMAVTSKTGEHFQTSVTGCIQRIAFDATITEIHVEHQRVPRLERDAVRHMRKLKRLSFDHCHVEVVEQAVFRNVPRLQSIRIVFNDVAAISDGIFSTLEALETLHLHNNKIAQIADEAFGNLTSLKVVRCGHNLLEEWRGEWFGNSTNVEVMDFQHNRIKSLPRRAFADFRRLKEVNFDHNELGLIYPEAFVGTVELDYLGLRYNRLTSIDANVFSSGTKIKIWSIGGNYLNFLSMRCMSRVVVGELEIDGNPWKCPCMQLVFHWLHEMNATLKITDYCRGTNVPVCSYPSFSHACMESVDEELTKMLLGEMRKIRPPLDRYCARLD